MQNYAAQCTITMQNAQFSILEHFSFHIPHSTFLIPHSTFLIPHSSFHILPIRLLQVKIVEIMLALVIAVRDSHIIAVFV